MPVTTDDLRSLTASRLADNVDGDISAADMRDVQNLVADVIDEVEADLTAEIATKAPLASPAFTGAPTAPTASAGTNTAQLATTAFVKAAVDAEAAARVAAVAAEIEAREDADALGDCIALTVDFGASTGVAVVSTIPAEQSHISMRGGQIVLVRWPITNGGTNTTLSIDGEVYDVLTLSGAAVPVGALMAGARYLMAFDATAEAMRVLQPISADDVVYLGALASRNTVGADQIDLGAVTLNRMADRAAGTFLGRRVDAGEGPPQEMDAEQARAAAGLGALATRNTVGLDQIDLGAVALNRMADREQGTFIGRAAEAGEGPPQQLSVGQSRTILGVSNVDNTRDADKPISTATQTALNAKAPTASPAFTGTPTAPTASAGTNTSQLATTAFVRNAVSTETAARVVAVSAEEAARIAADDSLREMAGGIATRPGEQPAAFVNVPFGTGAYGDPVSLSSISSADHITIESVSGIGKVAVVRSAPATVAPRIARAVHAGRIYLVLGYVRRMNDGADPSGNTVRLGVALMNATWGGISSVALQDSEPDVADGKKVLSALVSVGSPPLGEVDFELAASTVYLRPYVSVYTSDQATAIAQIEVLDVTEALQIDGALDVVALANAVVEAQQAVVEAEAAQDAAAASAADALAAEIAAETYAQMPFANRAAAVTALDLVPGDVTRVSWWAGSAIEVDAALVVARKGGATVIPDMPGWVPVEPVYVEHYGATGDGATFDDETMTVALEAGHAVVHTRPNRVYRVSNPILPTVTGPLTLRHDGYIIGDGSDPEWNTRGCLALWTNINDRYRIVVEGTGTIDASERVHIPSEASGSGMSIRYSDDAMVRGIKFYGGDLADGKADSGIVIEYCHRVLVDGCTFAGFNDHDIYATGGAFPVTDNTRGEILTVTNCFFRDNGAGSLRAARQYRQVILTGCQFFNCYKMFVGAGGTSNNVASTVFTITDNIGMMFRQGALDLRYSNMAAGSIIANNQIYDYGVLYSGSGISLRGSSNAIVTGNIIKPYLVDAEDSVSGNNCIYITAATGDDGEYYQAGNIQIFGNTLEVYDRDTACCIVDATNSAQIYDNLFLNAYPRDIRVNAPGSTDEVSTRSPRVRRMTTDGVGFGGTIPRRALQTPSLRISRDPYIAPGNVNQDLPDTQYLDAVTDSGGHNLVGRSSTASAKKTRYVSTTNTDNDVPTGGANGHEFVIRAIAAFEVQDDRSLFLVGHSAEPPVAVNNSVAISDGTPSTNGFGILGRGLYEKLSGSWYKIGQGLASFTVATLPSAVTVGAGARAIVTDSTVTTFHSTLTGGGANIVPVFSTGAVWRIG